VTAKLLKAGYRVRALARNGSTSAPAMFAGAGDGLQVVEADLRYTEQIPAGLMEGVDAVVCCTGTTAFPSKRWDGGNGPEATDFVAAGNLIRAAPQDLRRFVHVTSAGVERTGQLPWVILNLFGVLKYKRMSEEVLEASGLRYTIFRPGRLTDGPYTSFDLNTLLQATSGSRRALTLALTDRLALETSRVSLADAIVQSLVVPSTVGRKISMGIVEGDGPSDADAWKALFDSAVV